LVRETNAAFSLPADWSDITPGWMTAALRADFPGAEVGEVEVVFRDDGTNRRARLRLVFTQGAGPEIVFVKGEGAWRESHAKNGNMFNEAELFKARVPLPVDHPRPFHVVIDHPALDYVIVMEDVTRRGGDPRDATRPMTVTQVENGVRQLAALHSAYWNLGHAVAGLEWLQTREATEGWKQSLGPGLPVGRARAADILDGPIAERSNDELLGLCSRSLHSFGDGRLTLLHADPHIGNTYVLPDDSVGFLDWQVCRRGSWAMDLAYFLVSALTISDRRAAENRLLGAYLDALQIPRSERPSADEVRLRYDAAHAYGLVVWIVTHQSDRAQSPEVCRALIERFGAAFIDCESDQALDRLPF
jgi:aminoglycoside phosphotransferase (APT) family kinase protein